MLQCDLLHMWAAKRDQLFPMLFVVMRRPERSITLGGGRCGREEANSRGSDSYIDV